MRELIDRYAEGYAYQIAEGHAYLDQKDLALEWLERAYTPRDSGLATVAVNPLLHNLRTDPRCQPFLEKMGLVGQWDANFPI